MKDVRREEHILTSMYMITFMKLHYKDWLRTYTEAKPYPYKSLLRLCQGFAKRYNFSQRVPTHTKLAELEMTRIRDEFSATFWSKYNERPLADILNADETAVYYDMPPGKFWAEIGKSAKVDVSQKHSDRNTALLTCGREIKRLLLTALTSTYCTR
ncbi:hypothetical protein DYB25_010315 [Aphanomyces astaci]|uniref:DDE-1 domain-containing protein n=1 Tax=Aphanomyces astaci TaxID=112090 RepID=A0A397B0V5_APHAT|nr:hypothetical protein DYB25_010315 [Aphanomyces astaci]